MIAPLRPRSMSDHLAVRADAEDYGPSGCPEHPDRAIEMVECAESFGHFLQHWRFINRETGTENSFRSLWEGQERMRDAMMRHPWLIILKAGKLGASELECAFDGWQIRYGGINRRVHLFSMDRLSATNLLDQVKYGVQHLPDYMLNGFEIMRGEAGGENSKQVQWRAGRDDIRKLITYAPTKTAAIDQSAHHSHVDELARQPFPEHTWAAVESTVAPGGSVHIVSRGNGGDNEMTKLWEAADGPASRLRRVFEPYTSRPRYPETDAMVAAVERGEIDAMAAWYEEQVVAMPTTTQLYFFAPRTPEEALAGGGEDAYIDISRWDACYEPDLPELLPGDPIACVLSLDAGVSSDLFAAVLGSRDPRGVINEVDYGERAAIRAYRTWNGADMPEGVVDFSEVERWVRMICLGGCLNGHPNASRVRLSAGQMCSVHPGERYRHDDCEQAGMPCGACEAGQRIPRHNVAMIVYDRYELVDMMQRLEKEHVAWCEPMDQGYERTEADTMLRQKLMTRDIAHPENPDPEAGERPLRQHFSNAKAKIPSADDNRIRIEKRTAAGKVDLAVATSMMVKRVLDLDIKPRRAA